MKATWRPPAQASRATRFSCSPEGNAEKIGNVLAFISGELTVHCTGCSLPSTKPFGEVAATGRTAGTAVGFRQQLLDLVDARILVHVEAPIGHRQQPRQQRAEHRHEDGSDSYVRECVHVAYFRSRRISGCIECGLRYFQSSASSRSIEHALVA